MDVRAVAAQTQIKMVHVTLSRRNLQALLAKLDDKPADSACMLLRHTEIGVDLIIEAQEDADHYQGRTPGPMQAETEEAISNASANAAAQPTAATILGSTEESST